MGVVVKKHSIKHWSLRSFTSSLPSPRALRHITTLPKERGKASRQAVTQVVVLECLLCCLFLLELLEETPHSITTSHSHTARWKTGFSPTLSIFTFCQQKPEFLTQRSPKLEGGENPALCLRGPTWENASCGGLRWTCKTEMTAAMDGRAFSEQFRAWAVGSGFRGSNLSPARYW